MLDAGDLEAPRRLFVPRVPRGRTIASVLRVAASAVVTGAPATQQRVVGVYVPARWTGERQIVQRDPFDLPLDRHQKIPDERRQLVVPDVVHVPLAVLQPVLRVSVLPLLEHRLVQPQRRLQIAGCQRSAPGLEPSRLLPLLHGHRRDDLGALVHFASAILVAGETRRVIVEARPGRGLERAVRLGRSSIQLRRLPRAHARRRPGLHDRVAAGVRRGVRDAAAILVAARAVALEPVDRTGLLAAVLERAALLPRPRARLVARASPGPHAPRGARRLRQAAARRAGAPLPLPRHLPPVHELLLAVPAEEPWGPHRRRSPNYCDLRTPGLIFMHRARD